jgi:poly-gamma-glutamate capsule biosynthesis protein CapA/YwtB (metallophosphatase superfamily)
VDLIVLYMHWGHEYHRTPNDEQQNLAEMLAKEGVDIILGSHPHVIQPMELKKINMDDGTEKDVFVAYSLGNFVSNQRDQYTDSGVIVNIEIIKDHDGNVSIDEISYVPTWVYRWYHDETPQYRILPVKEFMDSQELEKEPAERIKAVWQETTDMLGLESFQVEE